MKLYAILHACSEAWLACLFKAPLTIVLWPLNLCLLTCKKSSFPGLGTD